MKNLKLTILLSTFLLILLGSVFSIYTFIKLPQDLSSNLSNKTKSTQLVKEDFLNTNSLNLEKKDNSYLLTDSSENDIEGITITHANQEEVKTNLSVELPKNYQDSINLKLDQERVISVKDNNSKNFTTTPLTKDSISLIEGLTKKRNQLNKVTDKYLSYQSSDKRKTLYYAYQKDEGSRQLKHWTVYNKSNNQEEKESYTISNAKLKKNNQGEIEVFYFGEQQLKNQEIIENVDTDLLSRAQRTLQAETGNDILNSDNYTPDFIIPKPYYLNQQGERVDLDWNLNQDSNTIEIFFTPKKEDYPIALDPTFQFVAPGVSGSGVVMDNVGDVSAAIGEVLYTGDFNADGKDDLVVGASYSDTQKGRVFIFYNNNGISSSYAGGADVVIIGEANSSYFGLGISGGDLNNDGKIDLIVSEKEYGVYVGGVYVFYNDGNYPTLAVNADIKIAGVNLQYFGAAVASGDLNNDGKDDLIAGSRGKVYVFYNDGSFPATIAGADITITGETAGGSEYSFGNRLLMGDFNDDDQIDLAAADTEYSSYSGRVYIFYNDGSIPSLAANAEVKITGEINFTFLGFSMAAGDFNNDSKTDLACGGYRYTSNNGRAYVFYNDGSYPASSSGAEVIIDSEGWSYFGASVTGGDFNDDGKEDLAVGAYGYNSYLGRAYIFYNDGSYPAGAGSVDKIISGETSSGFGMSMTSGDFDNDGNIDLVVGGTWYDSSSGRVYIFDNDGTYPTSATDADSKITGRTTIVGTNFGYVMISGDFDHNGKTDLVVGDYTVTTNTGQVYIFYNDGSIVSRSGGADVIITGEATTNYFGASLATGDFNGDDKTDLVVGAYGNATNTGKAYIFYNDGNYTSLAASADIIIAGEATNNYFSRSLGSGDFNNDNKDDLVVGADGNSTNTGKVYVFYTDGTIPAAASADIIITGEATGNYFGYYLKVADYNGDTKKDIITNAYAHTTNTGKVYLFYNDGTVPTTAATADSIITGEATNNYFGNAFEAIDFNADGKLDLVASSYGYNSSQGRVYVFYNDGSYPTLASGADIIINGYAGSRFGNSLTKGDLNNDGRADLAVGAHYSGLYSTNGGSVFVFYAGNFTNSALEANQIISGEATNNYFGYAITAGDFNADGQDDLAVGAYGYNTNVGRVYIFHTGERQMAQSGIINNDASINSGIGKGILMGDMNSDGKDDLIIGSELYSTNTGRVYIFFNDDSIASVSSGADIIITGEATNNYFGNHLRIADMDNNGKDDLIVTAGGYSSAYGRVYIFYNYGTISSVISSAQTITGTAAAIINGHVEVGDFDYDGKFDVAVAVSSYNANQGRAYIFYNDGSMPTSGANADVVITGEAGDNYFGTSVTSGDFNYDGRTDLAMGAWKISDMAGRAYIFYNDGSLPTSAGSADVIINGEAGAHFGGAMTAGDLSNDGKTDLIVCGDTAAGGTAGRLYAFYNDGTNNFGTVACTGSNPTSCSAANADVIITGNGTYMGGSPTVADFNHDGANDVAVSSYGYNSFQGKVHVFYNDGSIPASADNADVTIVGQTVGDYFGHSGIAAGDMNNDGKKDLIISSIPYNSSQGRVYVFYDDGTYPAGAGSADFIINGELTTSLTATYFGCALVKGDLNDDGIDDLVVGASNYSTNVGRVYIFYGKSNFAVDMDAADVVINGETSRYFGGTIYLGDLSNDGKDDLIVGAQGSFLTTGWVYTFYVDGTNNYGTAACTGSSPVVCSAVNADYKITGETNGQLGSSFAVADFNNNGRLDLAVGSFRYNNDQGRVYIFYGDTVMPTTAAAANVIISGDGEQGYFGYSLASGDLNNDSKNDLAVGAYYYGTGIGRTYIFYCDGTIPTAATSADAYIAGESYSYLGSKLSVADINNDNKPDLIVSGHRYSSDTGRGYIFYNDGSYPTSAASADIIVNTRYGIGVYGFNFLEDINFDGKPDLFMGGGRYLSIFYNDGSIPNSGNLADAEIFGDVNSGDFGTKSLVAGDFNGDKVADIAVGASTYGSNAGRVYLFNLKTDSPQNYLQVTGGVSVQGGAEYR